MRKLIFLPVFLAGFLISGCLYQEAADWQRCTFEVTSIRYVGVRENQTEWEIVLDVHNPGSRRLKLEGVRGTALIGTDTLAGLRNKAPLDLAPKGVTSVSLRAESPQEGWNTALAILRRDGKCKVTVNGDAEYRGHFGVKNYPGLFHKTYELDLATALNAMGTQLLQGFPFSF